MNKFAPTFWKILGIIAIPVFVIASFIEFDPRIVQEYTVYIPVLAYLIGLVIVWLIIIAIMKISDSKKEKTSIAIKEIALLIGVCAMIYILYQPVKAAANIVMYPKHIEVSAEEFNELIQEELEMNGKVNLYDLRRTEEFDQVHIKYAKLPVSDRCVNYDINVCEITYCDDAENYFYYSESGDRYYLVEEFMENHEWKNRNCLKNIYYLDDGLSAWMDEKFDIISR